MISDSFTRDLITGDKPGDGRVVKCMPRVLSKCDMLSSYWTNEMSDRISTIASISGTTENKISLEFYHE